MTSTDTPPTGLEVVGSVEAHEPTPPPSTGPDVPVDEPIAVLEPRVSRVVLRRLEPVSVLKLSLVFYLCVCLVLLVAGVLLWSVASAAGVVGNIETFLDDAGFDDFQFKAGELLRSFALGGVVLVLAGTLANMLLAVLFNLMSSVVGGIRFTLTEDLSPRRKR